MIVLRTRLETNVIDKLSLRSLNNMFLSWFLVNKYVHIFHIHHTCTFCADQVRIVRLCAGL